LRHSRTIGRVIAVAAAFVAAAVVAVVLLGVGSSDYRVHARFTNASQLVKGNLVQVAGVPVGKVRDIALTDDGQADVVLDISDDRYTPLRAGTLATVRQASLSGVANRYVDLRLAPGTSQRTIPDGGSIPASSTTSAVDLDELFDTFDPQTVDALRGVIRGFGDAYAGRAQAANDGWKYLNPSLISSSRLFAELDRDTPSLRRFITSTAGLVHDLAARRASLAGLVDHLATTTTAIGRQGRALGDAVGRLPAFMRRANTTFVNLRATLGDLTPLVDESKPVARRLRPFLSALRPLARDARPTLHDLATLIRRPGTGNDLVELTRATTGLGHIAVGPVQADGAQREGALPASTKALATATPELAFARPYAVDLTGWFDDFSHSGIYDALGGASRAAIQVNGFTNLNGLLQPILPGDREKFFDAAASLNQRNRCPGAVERGAAWRPTPDYNCDPTQVPLGK
jgi:phospholipid/cholesterol/gamma-HCH transport system substrate-binding protein